MRLNRLVTRLRMGKRRSIDRHGNQERSQNNTNENADLGVANNELARSENDIDFESNDNRFGDENLRGAIVASHTDSDDSDSDDEDDLDLPSGYLAFLSSHTDAVDNQISAVADQLRGNECASPVLQINFVREFIYDRGAILIASAMEEGCTKKDSGCSGTPSSGVIRNDVHRARTLTALQAFPPYRCPTRHLREIILSRCHIGDDGACAIAHAISNSCTSSLKTLDLSSNNITGAGVTCLANCTVAVDLGYDCGGNDCRLETLVLSSNPILAVGAFALTNALGGQRSKCPSHQKSIPDNAAASGTSTKEATGFCSLKHLHVSGCQLNDDDVILLGSALVPMTVNEGGTNTQREQIEGDSQIALLPSLPRTNHLMFLNLHRNHITMRGMEFLYSVVHNTSPSTIKVGAGDASDLHCLQSLYCQSNHIIELGVIVDYGTRDYNYGNFFDQEEDEQLLTEVRNSEMTGIESNVDLDQLKTLMMQKWLLKEKMMCALNINRHCALTLEKISDSSALSGQLAHAPERATLECAAWKKIAQVLEQKLRPNLIVLPRRQDEYGKYIEKDDFLGSIHSQCAVPIPPKIGNIATSLELTIFPLFFSWINQNYHRPTALAVVFHILRENPDVCGFHSAHMSKAPADGQKLI